MKATMLAIISVLLLTGCAVWHKPGATQQDFNQDKYQCERESLQMYPPSYNSTNSGYNTTCQNLGGGMVSCNTQNNPTSGFDTNQLSRSFAWKNCMQARGWSQQSRSD